MPLAPLTGFVKLRQLKAQDFDLGEYYAQARFIGIHCQLDCFRRH